MRVFHSFLSVYSFIRNCYTYDIIFSVDQRILAERTQTLVPKGILSENHHIKRASLRGMLSFLNWTLSLSD